MFSAHIVYGSTTGNTQYVAELAESVLARLGGTVTISNAADIQPSGICNGYDLILFGCSTWGMDSIELQDDFVPIFDAFETIGAQGKDTAVFGCGDSSYPYFCGAVDEISERLESLGAKVLDTLKIDGDPEKEKDAIERWVLGITQNRK